MNTSFLLYRHPDDFSIALQGAGFTFLIVLISALSVKISSTVIPLGWISLCAIFLWPRWSHVYLTPIYIAILGLIADLLIGRFLGLTSLIFLVFFWLVKPTQREDRLRFLRSWLEFSFISIIILFSSFFIIGRVVDVAVGWVSLTQQITLMIGVFPIIYLFRSIIRQWLIDPNNVNYQ